MAYEAQAIAASPQQALQTWTLTHSYFANMGGLFHLGDSDFRTAFRLVNCCIGSNHDPLETLKLSREDIKDKSKTDWFLKTIAMSQISWLILSVIDRHINNMHITQLEIATVAFSAFGIATYAANFSKPKDVGIPYFLHTNRGCSLMFNLDGFYSFSEWLDTRSMNKDTPVLYSKSRVPNDKVRPTSTISYVHILLAISSLVFGGLYCLAWSNSFPANIEKSIWKAASLASSWTPIPALIMNAYLIFRTHKFYLQYDHSRNQLGDETLQELAEVPMGLWEKLYDAVAFETFLSQSHQRFSNDENDLEGAKVEALSNKLKVHLSEKDLYRSINRGGKSITSLLFLLSGLTEDTAQVWRKFEEDTVKQFGLNDTIYPRDGLVYYSRSLYDRLRYMDEVIKGYNRYYTRFSWVTNIVAGVIYTISRLALIIICFTSLRSAPDDIYTTTWTRFIPNIS